MQDANRELAAPVHRLSREYSIELAHISPRIASNREGKGFHSSCRAGAILGHFQGRFGSFRPLDVFMSVRLIQ